MTPLSFLSLGFTLATTVWMSDGALEIYYMEDICGSTNDLSDIHSASVETSISLTYPNNMDCTISFTAPQGNRFFLQIQRFATEKSGDECYDYLNIYDGLSNASPAIESKLCGEITSEPEYNTTGDSITFEFKSDKSAKDRGFGIFLLAFTQGPSCGEDQLLCAMRNICIDSPTSICDDFDHCGDGTDETSCSELDAEAGKTVGQVISLILQITVPSVAGLIVLAVLIRLIYKKYKWSQYMKSLYNSKKLIMTAKVQASYPLTHHYQDDEYINVMKAEKDAAMVRIDSDPALDREIPYGSSSSLASTVPSVTPNPKVKPSEENMVPPLPLAADENTETRNSDEEENGATEPVELEKETEDKSNPTEDD